MRGEVGDGRGGPAPRDRRGTADGEAAGRQAAGDEARILHRSDADRRGPSLRRRDRHTRSLRPRSKVTGRVEAGERRRSAARSRRMPKDSGPARRSMPRGSTRSAAAIASASSTSARMRSQASEKAPARLGQRDAGASCGAKASCRAGPRARRHASSPWSATGRGLAPRPRSHPAPRPAEDLHAGEAIEHDLPLLDVRSYSQIAGLSYQMLGGHGAVPIDRRPP